MNLQRRQLLLAGATWPLATYGAAAPRTMSIEGYRSALLDALTTVERRIPSAPRKRIQFSVNLFLAHEVWIPAMPQDALLRAVDALKELGVDRVDINPGLAPWLDQDQATIAKYDAVVERIRQHGLKLHLNPQYSASRHRVSSWREWQDRAVSLYDELTRRYQPDAFVVAHEPTTMAKRLSVKTRPADWVEFVRTTARIVRNRSPQTRIGAGGLPSERAYFDAFARMPEVNVLTVDIYGLRDLRTVNAMIEHARQIGKPVYIEETWRPPFYAPGANNTLESISMQNIGNSALAEVDRRWLQVLTAYAQAQGLEAITPFWLPPLFAYAADGPGHMDDPAYNKRVVEAIIKGERTDTFRTLQKIIRTNQALSR